MSKLIVFSGAAGSGKGTVLESLFKMSDRFRYSVSFTTRKPRPGEKEGVNYFFVTPEEFEKRVREGDFAEHVEYCGNRYGTSRSYIGSLTSQGYDVILEIETVGAMKVMRTMHCDLSVFLAPPDFATLENRLRGRGTESEGDIRKRLERAREEILRAERYDCIVLNRDGESERCARAIFDIYNGGPPDPGTVITDAASKLNFIKSFNKHTEE